LGASPEPAWAVVVTAELDEADDAPWILRFGTTVGVAFVVAVVGTAPSALRVAKAMPDRGLFAVWAVMGAVAFFPSALLVALFRGARRGARSFLRERALAYGTRLFLFGALAPPVVVTFGALLRAKTHHHALAGVTFAVVTTIVLVAELAFASRVSSLLAARGEKVTKAGFVVAFVAFLASVAWVGLKASRAGGPAACVFLDVLALLLAAGFGSRRSFSDARALAFVGPPLAAAMLALGVATARELSQPLGEVRGQVVLYGPLLDRFSGR